MKVRLLKLFKSFNKLYSPGEYLVSDLPLSIRNNPQYVEVIKENPVVTEVVTSEPVTLKVINKRKKESILEEEVNNAPQN